MGNAPLWGTSKVSKVPQGSLLFNIYMCEMFFETPSNIAITGYADDNTPYTYYSNM